MPIFDPDDRCLHYQWSSRGGDDSRPTIVFAHPLGSDLGVWNPQRNVLGKQFRILQFDFPGHGKSGPLSENATMDRLGKDVIDLLDFLTLEDVFFCGVSLGGMVGQWIGANAADRVKRLILANTCARIADTKLLRRRIESLLAADGDHLESIADNVINGWFTVDFQKNNPEAVAAERARLLQTSARSYAAMATLICNMDLTGVTKQIASPTLVISGSHDRATPPEWNRELADGIPNARYVELNAAHLSSVEAGVEFNRLVRDFSRT